MHALPFVDLIAFLRRRLEKPLPGPEAHLSMAPGRNLPPDALGIAGKPCRKASVLALLFPHGHTTSILLTKRRETLSHHPGQVSFPGGRNEPEESLLETALRETHEEVGLPPEGIDVLGGLSPLYISVSNFCVYPFIGALHTPPERLIPQAEEVQRILTVPLAELANPSIKRIERWDIRGVPADIPFYGIDGETIWGATAMMLSELLALFDSSSPYPAPTPSFNRP